MALSKRCGNAGRRVAARRRAAGFTLIELMVTVGIIGILAAVALPAYQDYVIRSRVTEGLELAASVRQSVAAYHDRWGVLPKNNESAGLPRPADLRGVAVESVEVRDGAIVVKFSAALSSGKGQATRDMVLRPALNKAYPTGALAWVCNQAAAPAGFDPVPLPSGLGLLPETWLPRACRA